MFRQTGQWGLSRRELGLGLAGAMGLVLAGCGGGDDDDGQPLYTAFNGLRGGMTREDVQTLVGTAPVAGTSSQLMRWESETEILEVRFSGTLIASARWTDRVTGKTYLRTFSGGSRATGGTGSLYQAFLALRPGMTKAAVIGMVPVRVSQGGATSQVLWIDGQESLGVRFNGSGDGSVITFAQWGLSIPAGNRDETRTF